MRGEEAVLGHGGGREGQFGDLARDEVQIRRTLGVAGEHLEEACVVDAVEIVMAAVHVEAGLGDGPAADVEHIGQALARGGVQGFVHEGHALGRGEIGGAQAGHAHARGDSGGGMLGFRLHEDQAAVGDVHMPFGHFLRPVFAHLGGGGDGVGAGGVGGLALAHDDGGVAIHGHAPAGVLDFGLGFLAEVHGHYLMGKGCLRITRLASRPFTGCS